MLHKPPHDDSKSYTVKETKVGNTTVTSYYTVCHRQKREETDRELDEQFSPTTLGADMVADATQWLSASVTSFRTLKYLWFIIGGTSTSALAAVIIIPVVGIFAYQFMRYHTDDDDAGKVLVFWRVALVILGGLL
jgi:hypothetical protein